MLILYSFGLKNQKPHPASRRFALHRVHVESLNSTLDKGGFKAFMPQGQHGFSTPSVRSLRSQADGNAIGMGCFSTEQIAWEVMKTFLGKSEQMNLEQATIAWDVDVVGEEE